MKFSEEEATELMQYVTDRRSYEYEKLKEKVKKDMERTNRGCIFIPVADHYLFGESMLRIGRINSLYSLLNKAGALSWDDFMHLEDEVYDKFDIESIREEIRNQRSLEK